jgi:hypothetical protein
MNHAAPRREGGGSLVGDLRTEPASAIETDNLRPDLSTQRALLSGGLAGAAPVVEFTAVHHLLISDIWYALGPMVIAGAVCGVGVTWSYRRLFRMPSAAGWLMYNLAFVPLPGVLDATRKKDVLWQGKSPRPELMLPSPLT